MGPKIWPSGPCMVNSGMKAHTMIAVEKNKGRSTSWHARMIRSFKGSSAYSPELRCR